MNISESVRDIKRNSEVMEMVPIAFQCGIIVMHVEAVVVQDLKGKNIIEVQEPDARAMGANILDGIDGNR